MKSFYATVSNKIIDSQYLSRWIVLLIDSFVSSFATLSVYLVLGFFVKSDAPTFTYVLVGMLSFFASMGMFLLFGTYRGIMRHTTMQEISRISFAVLGV